MILPPRFWGTGLVQGYYGMCDFEQPEDLAEEIREEILTGRIQAAFVWGDRIYVHAGIRLRILEEIGTTLAIQPNDWEASYDRIADYLNELAASAVDKNDYSHPIFWIDSARGGRDEAGGIFWADYRDLRYESLNPLRQVVGHSPPLRKIKDAIRWTLNKRIINIDTGINPRCGDNIGWLVADSEGITAKILWKDKIITKKIADK